MQDLAPLCADLVRFGRLIHQKNFVSASDGNLSIRLDANRILATPTAVSKGLMQPEDMVVVDMNGHHISGSRHVSSEILMHLTIYRMRPDVNAVVHAHPPVATGFACAGIALDQPICSEIIVTLGAVPLAPYATTGTPALSESILHFLPDYDAVLLANHGVVAYGSDLMTAYMRMETVEHYANILLTTYQLGCRNELSEEHIADLVNARKKYEGTHTLATLPVGAPHKKTRSSTASLLLSFASSTLFRAGTLIANLRLHRFGGDTSA